MTENPIESIEAHFSDLEDRMHRAAEAA